MQELSGRGRRPARAALLILIALFFLSAALAYGGCGKSEEGVKEEKEEAEVREEETAEEEAGAAEEAEEVEEEEEEEEEESVTGGSTEFRLEEQSIGSGVFMTDLEVTDIYWQDHGDFFRIVFEYRRKDGGEPTKVPNVSTFYGGAPGNEEYWNIYINLSDITIGEMKVPTFYTESIPVSLGNPLVKTMERTPTADTESVVFLVKCAYSPAHPGVSSRPHRIMYQTRPMRVMVDIQKQ